MIDDLQNKLDLLRDGRREGAAMVSVQAVISSYALEIGLKSLWALDNAPKSAERSGDKVPHIHYLLTIFGGLSEETKEKLEEIGLTRSALEEFPKPFFSNRYSMESRSNSLVSYDSGFLRKLGQLLEETLDLRRKEMLLPPGKGVIGDPQSTVT
ncbi:MAG: hypothetical protein F4X27_08535 [Chloroflexi bacterium]|nr:hypothetical protein [Chloroflexota bacterium]